LNSVDRTLLGIFSGEQAEHVSRIRALADDFVSIDDAARQRAADELLRRLHTLKGAARAVGLESTEQLCHQAEEVVSRGRRDAPQVREPVRRLLQRMADAVEDILAAAIEERKPPDVSELANQLGEVTASPGTPKAAASTGTDVAEAANHVGAAPELLRIDTQRVDDVIRVSSELLTDFGSEAEKTRAAAHASSLDDVQREWQRLRRAAAPALHELQDRPENQAITECIAFIDRRLAMLSREANAISDNFNHMLDVLRERAGRVYDEACRIRMTSAEGVLGTFGPMVRHLAQDEGREVEFQAEGLETNADRLVLQSLKDPVMHLLRNAVSHGIETPQERVRAGKSAAGKILLRLTSRGDRLTVRIEDDGRGLNYERVANEARARGLLGRDEVLDRPEAVARFVFQPGFSTAKLVTGVSGRGIGLAVVQQAANRLRGEVSLQPRAGGGTVVLLSVPISISTEHVLLVGAGGHTFGITAALIDGLYRVKESEVRNVSGRESILTDTGPVTLVRLPMLLGLSPAPVFGEEPSGTPCVSVSLGGRRVAFAVDRLIDERDALIKDTGLPEGSTALVQGAIPLEDGTVAVVLNMKGVFAAMGRTTAVPMAATPARRQASRKTRILVVDDSLTTRSLEKSILEAHGYEVKLAVDGLEALERLQIETPDLVISDVMMPRLTGFQLLEKMKNDEALKKIPVILVTSLENREEQHLGMSLGADAYIVKQKFDQRELLNVIREIV